MTAKQNKHKKLLGALTKISKVNPTGLLDIFLIPLILLRKHNDTFNVYFISMLPFTP